MVTIVVVKKSSVLSLSSGSTVVIDRREVLRKEIIGVLAKSDIR